MSTNYPGALDSFVNPTATDTLDSATVPHAAQHDNINDAMSAVQVTLGVNPQGGSATVVARLTALDSTVAGKAATNQTMYVGTTAIAINRSSASQTLTGVSIDGNAATATSATTAGNATTVTNGVYSNVSNTFTTGTQIIQAGSNTTVPLRLKRNSASQTADILQANSSDDATTLAKIDAAGKITATDFVDSSMTTAGVVTNTSAGLLQSTTTLDKSLGGTGSTYGSLMIGHSQLNAIVTKNANDTTPEAIFRTGTANSTIQYFNVDADTLYFFEGFIQLGKTATSSVINTSLLYVQTGSTTALTEQSARLQVQYNSATAFIGAGVASATATSAASPATALTTIYLTFRGFIRTNATTAGRINIASWLDTAGASAPTWTTGSYINLYKVGTGNAQTFGNWTA